MYEVSKDVVDNGLLDAIRGKTWEEIQDNAKMVAAGGGILRLGGKALGKALEGSKNSKILQTVEKSVPELSDEERVLANELLTKKTPVDDIVAEIQTRREANGEDIFKGIADEVPVKTPETPSKMPQDVPNEVKAPDVPTVAAKAEDPLLQEARKYKSAEEFVKAQGETVYRGGKELSDKNITDAGVSVASHKKIAEDFVKQKGGTVSEYKIRPEAKIVDFQDVPNVKFKNLNDYSPELDTGDKQIWRDLEVEYQKAINWAKQNGYDAVKLPLEREVRVINPDVLKTKSQLTDIWNKANKK